MSDIPNPFLSRRDFLKLWGLAFAGLAARPLAQLGELVVSPESTVHTDLGQVTLGSETRFTAFMAWKPETQVNMAADFDQEFAGTPKTTEFPQFASNEKMVSHPIFFNQKEGDFVRKLFVGQPVETLGIRFDPKAGKQITMLCRGPVGSAKEPIRQGLVVLAIDNGDKNLRSIKFNSSDSKVKHTLELMAHTRLPRENNALVPPESILAATVVPGAYDAIYINAISQMYKEQALSLIISETQKAFSASNGGRAMKEWDLLRSFTVGASRVSQGIGSIPSVYLMLGTKLDLRGLRKGMDGQIYAAVKHQLPVGSHLSRTYYADFVDATYALYDQAFTSSGNPETLWVSFSDMQVPINMGE